jgi:hypothetical protein
MIDDLGFEHGEGHVSRRDAICIEKLSHDNRFVPQGQDIYG